MKKRDFLRRMLGIVPAVVIGKNLPSLDEPVKQVELKPENKVMDKPDRQIMSSGCSFIGGGISGVYFVDRDAFFNVGVTTNELKKKLRQRKYNGKRFG